jgi:hypothetical protein
MTRLQQSFSEPFDGRTLRKYLEKRHDAKFLRQTGSHGRMKLPNGLTVPMVAERTAVTNVVMRKVMEALDMTHRELREDMGFPLTVRRKGRARTQPAKTLPSRKDVIGAIADIRRELAQIEEEVCRGHRDPDAYRRAFEALSAARAEAAGYRTGDQFIREAHSAVP